MRLRSAQTLVFSRQAGEIVAFNYLTNTAFACSHDLFTFLSFLDDWKEFEEVAGFMPTMAEDELKATVQGLIDVNAVTGDGSDLANAEEEFRTAWNWGVPAALFHFSVQDKKYLSIDQSEALQRAKLAECQQPKLFMRNGDEAVSLPPALADNELLQLMARRRTVRSAVDEQITLKQLSDCLFAGLGITGQTQNCVGTLPLSMTPSGGARNPYEAYVYARSVEGLEPGFYHYSAFDHTLGRVDTDRLPKPSELMGGQEWTDEMPCVIILCALFERTMWKYDDANAYRVVLIEAGHIGQNLMLAATHHGLSACPSAALNHSEISECVAAKNRFTHSPIYALTLARPGVPAPDSTPLELAGA
jgi:SagB-type dehydrogenase family enzyme